MQGDNKNNSYLDKICDLDEVVNGKIGTLIAKSSNYQTKNEAFLNFEMPDVGQTPVKMKSYVKYFKITTYSKLNLTTIVNINGIL